MATGGDGKTYVKLMVSRLRMCVLCFQSPSGQSKLSTTRAEPRVALAPRSGHQGCAWLAEKERRARNPSGVRTRRDGPQVLLLRENV